MKVEFGIEDIEEYIAQLRRMNAPEGMISNAEGVLRDFWRTLKDKTKP